MGLPKQTAPLNSEPGPQPAADAGPDRVEHEAEQGDHEQAGKRAGEIVKAS
jgi:hypothetical protein